MEIWKDVVGFERAYQVSNLGKRSKAGGLRWAYNFGGEE